jgi:hypothetical protein
MPSRNSERQPTPELLKEAGDVVRTSGRSIREVANELSITYTSLLNSLKAKKNDLDEGFTSDERKDVRRLLRVVRELPKNVRDPNRKR